MVGRGASGSGVNIVGGATKVVGTGVVQGTKVSILHQSLNSDIYLKRKVPMTR